MPYKPDLWKVGVLVKTFLRDAHLAEAVAAISDTMPEVEIVVVDDGEQPLNKVKAYDVLRSCGHQVVVCPFDSGFGYKSNRGAAACTRPYLLIGSDDFNFRPASVRQGIEWLVTVLDNDQDVHIASGRVNGYPYEGWLHDYGDRIVEEYIRFNRPHHVEGVEYHMCNLTVNYSLIRRDILGPANIHWDDDVKIGGGEHGAFFVDVKRAGYGVAYVTDVNITEQACVRTDPRYSAFRGRARRPERPCFVKRGIREYVMFGGAVEKA